ncbi:cytochrome c oxidase assembly protein [Chromobacterium haemolyticum]|nr:cytochrome c oxidase assembly protein [Chromobacterium haemolyticum]
MAGATAANPAQGEARPVCAGGVRNHQRQRPAGGGGQAIPRYLPAAAGEYVKKLECFCFRQQAFAPGETRRFPVVFVVDKRLPASIDSITLAYTVFDVPGNTGAGS